MLIRLDDRIARQPLVLAYSALLVPRAEIGVDGRAERGLEPPRLAWAHRAALQRARDEGARLAAQAGDRLDAIRVTPLGEHTGHLGADGAYGRRGGRRERRDIRGRLLLSRLL